MSDPSVEQRLFDYMRIAVVVDDEALVWRLAFESSGSRQRVMQRNTQRSAGREYPANFDERTPCDPSWVCSGRCGRWSRSGLIRSSRLGMLVLVLRRRLTIPYGSELA